MANRRDRAREKSLVQKQSGQIFIRPQQKFMK
jgi:hypothetical protein